MEAICTLYDALVSISVPNEKAQAVVDALEREMTTTLATKADLETLRVATKADLDALGTATKADLEALREATKADLDALQMATRSEIESARMACRADVERLGLDIRQEMRQESALLRKDIEIRLRDVTIHNGYMLVVGLGLLFAALQLT